MGRRRILFVHGLDPHCRARDVAYEFERYGRIIRCDIPAQRVGDSNSGYAFVEFEDSRDAEDAYRYLHGRRFVGGVLKIQWAKRAPRAWRRDEDHRRRGGRSRSRSRTRSRSPQSRRESGRSRSPAPSRNGVTSPDDANNNTNNNSRRSGNSKSPERTQKSSMENGSLNAMDNITISHTNGSDMEPMPIKA